MRNTLIGGVLAIVFVAAVFAVAYFHPHKTQSPSSMPTPSEAARAIPMGFTGSREVGAWEVFCPPRLPPPGVVGEGWENGKGSSNATAAPKPVWMLQRCRLLKTLRNAGDPKQWVDVILTFIGQPQRFLVPVVRLAPGIVPAGSDVDLWLDRKDIKLQVIFCGPIACPAAVFPQPKDSHNITTAEVEQIGSVKNAALVLPPSPGKKAVTLNIPLTGVGAALAAIHRLNGIPTTPPLAPSAGGSPPP